MEVKSINSVNLGSLISSTLKSEIEKLNQTETKKDSAEISDTAKVFNKIDEFFNLGKPGRFDLASIGKMNDAEKEEFFKMLGKMLQEGFVGYEILEVDGKKEKHFIVNQIGDERLKNAKLYKDRSDHYKGIDRIY